MEVSLYREEVSTTESAAEIRARISVMIPFCITQISTTKITAEIRARISATNSVLRNAAGNSPLHQR
jgi:hypothetical protein